MAFKLLYKNNQKNKAMTVDKSYIINASLNEIVKYGTIENLKKFNISQPEDKQLLPPNAFTRNRKMPLSDLINFIIWPRANSTAVELFHYSQLIKKDDVTKSNVSKMRRYIDFKYLAQLCNDMVKACYAECESVDRWNGYLLLAGDGSTFSLPMDDNIKQAFLEDRKTGKSDQPLARGVILKDVLNDLIVGANMEGYGRDEIQLLIELLEQLAPIIRQQKIVLILDRKFCAYTLIAKLLSLGIDFIIRVKSRFNETIDDFIASGKTVQTGTISPASTTVKKLRRLYGRDIQTDSFNIRLVRLNSGIVVMTSLLTEELTGDTVSDIYHKRWDDETTIGFVKNNLQIEIFSGMSVNCLEQDFYSKIITYNLLSLFISQAAEMRHADKPNEDREKYKINRNIALGLLKLYLPQILHSQCDVNHCLFEMLKEMARYVTQIKHGRHNHRAFRKIKHSGKYITMTNYSRAI